MSTPSHIMVDIETLGTAPGCAVLSIGAVEFDPFSERVGWSPFYRTISLQSNYDAGLRYEPRTVEFWLQQSDSARTALLQDNYALSETLDKFSLWCALLRQGANGSLRFWCNGPTFDTPILEGAYSALRLDPPFKYNESRCQRTILELAGMTAKDIPFDGEAHNALADAKHQVKLVQLAYKKLGMNNVNT